MVNKEIRTEVVKKEDGDTQTRMVAYSAPLPPASEFERYEAVLSGAADRIIKLAENQNKHRRFIEKFVVVFDSFKSLAGLFAALAIVLASIYAGVYLIMNNKSTQGLTTLFTPLALMVGAFLYQKHKESEDGKK